MTNFVFEALYCTQNANGEPVMGSNPLVLCYVGKHATLFASAVLASVCHGLLFPVCSAWIIYRIRARHVRLQDTRALAEFDHRPMWKYFLSDDYKPHLFWFRHIELALFFTTTVCNVILVHENIHGYLAGYVAALVLTIGLYWTQRPFADAHAWRLHVRNSLSLCSTLYVLTNYCSSPLSFDGQGPAHVAWLAPIAMASSVLLFLVLIVSFVAVLLHGAKTESLEIQQRDERAIDSAASMFGPKGGAVVHPMRKGGGGQAFSNPLFRSRRTSTYRSKMAARVRRRAKRSNILRDRQDHRGKAAELEMVPTGGRGGPAGGAEDIPNPLFRARQETGETDPRRREAHDTAHRRSKRSDRVPANTPPPAGGGGGGGGGSEGAMNEGARAAVSDEEALAPRVEDAWTEHYDPRTKAAYYECVRVRTTWTKSAAAARGEEDDDAATVVEHVDPASGHVYYESRRRRVTWTRPSSSHRRGAASTATATAVYTSELARARQNLATLGERAKPPEGIKHTTVWWQLLDDEGHTCYLNRVTEEVQYHQPSGWVKHRARERFGGISRGAAGAGAVRGEHSRVDARSSDGAAVATVGGLPPCAGLWGWVVQFIPYRSG